MGFQQSCITHWAKGAAAQGPQSRGAPKAKTKKLTEFDCRKAMQCFMCVQCMVFVDCRVSAVLIIDEKFVEKFVLLNTKLALQSKHFSAQNTLKLICRHLRFQKIFRG